MPAPSTGPGDRSTGQYAAIVTSSFEVVNMAMRPHGLSPEELAIKRALEHSWKVAMGALVDPGFREQLEAAIERVSRSSAPQLTRAEFLYQTAPPAE